MIRQPCTGIKGANFYAPPRVCMTPRETKPKRRRPKPMNLEGVELHQDAWPKFEKLVKSAAKMGPQPHKAVKS